MKKLFSISISLILLLLFQTAVFAGSVTLQASPAKVQAGGEITLAGTADADCWITLRGLGSDGSIVYFTAIRADGTGAFKDVFKAPDAADILKIVAGSGSDIAEATVAVTAKTTGGGGTTGGGSTGGGGGGGSKASEKPVVVIPENGLPAGATIVFNDVDPDAWYAKAVTYLAERGIVNGIGGGNYGPDSSLTRGQFMVMVMKAYGIQPGANGADNFADAGDTWYTAYLAEAKRLGLAEGIGNNAYAPERTITRQETFTLLYRTIKLLDKVPSASTGKTLADFGDRDQIAPWATEAMTALVSTGTLSGSAGMLDPEGNTSRAQMAQVLYNLLVK